MTINWTGKNWKQFKESIPNYIKISVTAECKETNQIHMFTNIGIVYCDVGNFIVFPPRENIKNYKSEL